MTQPVSFETRFADRDARSGTLATPHGDINTPAFMAVGTRASVKTIDSGDLEEIGAQIVLSNTYHLMLRPGSEVIEKHGGLHEFMAWPGPILTDSGGYQVLSLRPRISEEALVFSSTYDGSSVELTPERSIAIQQALGADITMALDVPVALPAPREATERAMLQTLRWAERSKRANTRADRALFGIIQGGSDPELRRISARETAGIGFPGFGIGGLAVGESAEERAVAIDSSVSELPEAAARYVMGLGDTEGLLDAVSRGVDLFDCVLPTRLARHGKALTRNGDISIKRSEWKYDTNPIELDCPCPVCQRYSRSYIRHLHRTHERTADRLLTLHNLSYTYRLMEDMRAHIADHTFGAFHEEVTQRRRVNQQIADVC